MAKRALKLCKEPDCRNEQTTVGYCRLHYLKNWKTIRDKQRKKAMTNLNKYINHIMKRNPDGYVDKLKSDLRDGTGFQRKADDFVAAEDFHDIMDDVDIEAEAERLVDNLKIDETF